MGMVAEGIFHSNEHFLHTKNYLELTKKYQRQEWMIFGEASVFIISLVIGIWLINRGYNKEIEIAHQRRNFLLSITHELKSPIASIRLVLETFLKRKLKPEQFERFGKNAIKDSERLNELVNNLLFAAKLETAYQPHLQPIHLDELTTDLVDSLSEKFPNVIFTKNIQNEISSFEGDQNGMVSIITNLIENAVKYNFTEHPKIEINLVDQNEKITLEISDNGIGISDKEKKKIFERFYRVGNEDTRTTKGTGLGLYIVSQIVKAHQGKITVANNHPKGTIFKIVFHK
ncbi:MAG: signal transduction histidine kinase [Granulosicoccus sp.]|jgi:signal transduction histidine kinase